MRTESDYLDSQEFHLDTCFDGWHLLVGHQAAYSRFLRFCGAQLR